MIQESDTNAGDGSNETRDESRIVEKRLCEIKSEIATVQSSPLEVFQKTDAEREESVLHELEKSLTQLRETLSFTKSQINELKGDIEHDTETNKELRTVVESLKKKLDDNATEADETNKELQARIQERKETFKYIRKNLVAFIKEHFPLPSQEAISETRKKLRSADHNVISSELLSLKEILEELLEKSINEPNDPYIVIDRRFWPPYLELLLRSKIVLRHRDDEHRIKLVSFHL